MKKPLISIVAAIGHHRELGFKNHLLWNIPEDMQRFKKLTLGHPVIMGRITYESIGKPLTGRENLIISRDKNLEIAGCHVCHSLKEALDKAGQFDQEEIFIIGGGQVYKEGMEYANKLYLTVVEGVYEADTYFPDYSVFGKIVSREKKSDGKYKYTFLELIRVGTEKQ